MEHKRMLRIDGDPKDSETAKASIKSAKVEAVRNIEKAEDFVLISRVGKDISKHGFTTGLTGTIAQIKTCLMHIKHLSSALHPIEKVIVSIEIDRYIKDGESKRKEKEGGESNEL